MPGAEARRQKHALTAALALALAAAMAALAAPPVALQEHAVGGSREARLRQMEPAQRDGLLRKMWDWDALPLEQRMERRARYAAWLELTPLEQAQLRGMAAQVDRFEPDRVQALRAQFEALDGVQQRAWRSGPQLGGIYPALQPLLAYAPQDQRRALLATLRSMPAAQHRDLAVLVQRAPPQERRALREELLRLAPAQRAGWLERRLAQ